MTKTVLFLMLIECVNLVVKKKKLLNLIKELSKVTTLTSAAFLQLMTSVVPKRTNSGHEKPRANNYFVGIREILDFFLP